MLKRQRSPVTAARARATSCDVPSTLLLLNRTTTITHLPLRYPKPPTFVTTSATFCSLPSCYYAEEA